MDIVIFGISGNLAKLKLIPALINLYQQEKIPKDTRLIGFSRSRKDLDLPFEYVHIAGSYSDRESFLELKKILREDKKQLLYLALPPDISSEALISIKDVGLTSTILIEKPFGKGYQDASALASYISSSFSLHQCLKVDHYSGKKELREMSLENPENIDEVIFEMFETNTVEERSGYYDAVGALRDVGQNHLLFSLSTFFLEAFKDVKKEFKKRENILSKLETDHDSLGYTFGCYEGYTAIETFFSIPARLNIEQFRHIKIVLRSGKGLSQNRAGIIIKYKNGESNEQALKKEIIFTPGTKAYEQVFMDALTNKYQYFISDEEVLSAWKFIEAVEKIKREKPFISYSLGSDFESVV